MENTPVPGYNCDYHTDVNNIPTHQIEKGTTQSLK